MSYYLNRIDEKLVRRRTTSAKDKKIADLEQQLAKQSVQTPTSQGQGRRSVRDATKSPVPKDRAYIHTSDKTGPPRGEERRFRSGERNPFGNVPSGIRVAKKDATARGMDTQQATGSGNRAKRRMRSMGITEAIYNSFVDIAYLIEAKLRKTRPGEPATRVRGKFYRADSPGRIGYRRVDGELKPYRVNKSREGLRSQEGYTKRPVASKVAAYYKRLHQKANAGDKKALELLRRAEMSGND